MDPEKKEKTPAKRYYRKRVHLLSLIEKIKLWPSRKGILHGIRSIEKFGDQARVTTHCNKDFLINNSRTSRAARWLRNKMFIGVCPKCGVPDWKLEKYDSTRFSRHQGSLLLKDQNKKETEGVLKKFLQYCIILPSLLIDFKDGNSQT